MATRMMTGTRSTARVRRNGWLLALMFSVSITLIGQKWVGDLTLYETSLQPVRELMHASILHNQLPDSVTTWRALGANGLNIRLLTVWSAEGLHELTGMPVHRSYRVIETFALLACCLLLYAFLEPLAGWQFALGSLLYWGSVVPLTYLYHNFHPWDKPSIALWLLALICTWRRWWWALAAVLLVGVATKYDIVVFPALVFLAWRKTEPWKSMVLRTTLLFAITFSTYFLLRMIAPGGFEPRPALDQIAANFQAIRDTTVTYPPLLALGAPAVLAAIGFSVADQFARACVQLMVLMSAILFLQTNFVEFRAEVALLILLLPAAWYGLLRLTRTETAPATP